MVRVLNNSQAGVSSYIMTAVEQIDDRTGKNSGLNQANIIQPTPHYNAGVSEEVISSGTSYIIIGRDRPRGLESGFGGSGQTHCGTIDLVAGLSGMLAREVNDNNEKVATNKSPELDAARIYISQRTDIDENFGITPGSVGNLGARSGIAVKADNVRIIGREGIKLVTSSDVYNSQGVNIRDTIAGIDLIAGNETSINSLEPLVKGDALAQSLKELAEMVRDLNGNCIGLLSNIADLHKDFAFHTHISAVGPVSPPPIGMVSGGLALIGYVMDLLDFWALNKNVKAWELNNLHPFGADYINSNFNKTN